MTDIRNSIILAAILLATACTEAPVPKPTGYFRIAMPQHKYYQYDSINEPYSFETSYYSKIQPDNDENAEAHWINIYYPDFKCKIHVTYRTIDNNAEEVLEDSRKLVYKHTVKADAINESYYENNDDRIYASLYRIKGNAATPLQFSLTDSTDNLFRGSLYFYARPNADSLAPVVEYIEEDIVHLIETFKWNK